MRNVEKNLLVHKKFLSFFSFCNCQDDSPLLVQYNKDGFIKLQNETFNKDKKKFRLHNSLVPVRPSKILVLPDMHHKINFL